MQHFMSRQPRLFALLRTSLKAAYAMRRFNALLAAWPQVKLTPGLPAHWGLLKQRLEKVCPGSQSSSRHSSFMESASKLARLHISQRLQNVLRSRLEA